MSMTEKELLVDVPNSIKEHSKRHAILSSIIAKKLNLPEEQIEILKRVGWVHDIGGDLKEKYKEEQKSLLQMEFAQSSEFGSKPSFNPNICIEHAKERVKLGLRTELTDKELKEPFLLYLEEFAVLKQKPLSLIEKELLKIWWYHPLYSINMLEQKLISVPPEVEILVRCNEQPWLLESDERVVSCLQRSSLTYNQIKLLLAIVRAADVVENGNNAKRRKLRNVSIEDFQTTINFIKYKFDIDGLKEYGHVIEALEDLKKEGDEELLNVILQCRGHYIKLNHDFPHASITTIIQESFVRINRCKNRVTNYLYDSKNEYEVLYNNLWYKFSFVKDRRGEFDKTLLLEEVLPKVKYDELDIPHLSPENRPCPFCNPNIDEVLCKVELPSQSRYVFLANIDPYGVEHMIMCAKKDAPQILSEEYVVDLLSASYALGHHYEGSFTSFSGASIKHWHGQFYQVKTPVWKNIFEGRTEVINQRNVDGVICGELSNWPARTFIFKGKDKYKVAQQVWQYTLKLMHDGVAYNTKFLYSEEGDYIWLLSPRTHGFMTFAKYFLEGKDAIEPKYVSGCGSIEVPGGDVIMFFDPPKRMSVEQKALMASRFEKTIRETSNWQTQGLHTYDTLTAVVKQCNKETDKIAHRIESIDDAKKAIKLGYHIIEVDVQMTKDHVLVALWGAITDCNGHTYQSFELTYDEMSLMLNDKVLKIDELCQTVNGEAAINFDIKDWSDTIAGYRNALIHELLKLIKKYHLQNNALFDSFNSDIIYGLKQEAIKIGMEIITGSALHPNLNQGQIIDRINEMKILGFSTLFIYPQNLSYEVIKAANQANISIISSDKGITDDVKKMIQFLVIDN